MQPRSNQSSLKALADSDLDDGGACCKSARADRRTAGDAENILFASGADRGPEIEAGDDLEPAARDGNGNHATARQNGLAGADDDGVAAGRKAGADIKMRRARHGASRYLTVRATTATLNG